MRKIPLILATIGFATVLSQSKAAEPSAAPRSALKGFASQEQLDAAIREFNGVIDREVDALVTKINEKMDQAVDDADLELAKKCRAAKKALEERGELPSDGFVRAAVIAGQRNIDRAANKLQAVFKDVSKEILKGGDVEAAEAIQQEGDAVVEQARNEWRPYEHNESTPKQSEKQKKAPFATKKPLAAKSKPSQFLFRTQDEIGKSWTFVSDQWRLENAGIRFEGDGAVVSKQSYVGDFRVQITYEKYLSVTVCGNTFQGRDIAEGTTAFLERKGDVLKFSTNKSPVITITLKQEQQAQPTTIQIGNNRGIVGTLFLRAVQVLGTVEQAE